MVQMPRAHRDGAMKEAKSLASSTSFTRDLIQPSSGVYVLRIGWSATPPADLAQRSEEEVMKSSSFKHRIGKKVLSHWSRRLLLRIRGKCFRRRHRAC